MTLIVGLIVAILALVLVAAGVAVPMWAIVAPVSVAVAVDILLGLGA